MPTCFVVMGFKEKTDYATGRTPDLDKSYRTIIKPAVVESGLECIRADEIRHSGVIDVPMYQHLLGADLVIADLSTANSNAFYELGVRHALRPFSTITIAESQLVYPFDVNHTAILRYEHLGKVIDIEEAMRMRDALKETIRTVMAAQNNDSPVRLLAQPQGTKPHRGDGALTATGPGTAAPGVQPAIAELLATAYAVTDRSDFATARGILASTLDMTTAANREWTADDDYLLQRLALATYKSKQPTPQVALEEAATLLQRLKPATSNDTETLGLWGAVQKRLWNVTGDRKHLDKAVTAYERGFYLRNDCYNGINVAFLLNVRASISTPAEAIADFVQANRIRGCVVALCDELLKREVNPADQELLNERFWVLATLAEAWLGLGDAAQSADRLQKASALKVADWMRGAPTEQLAQLRGYLAASPLRHVQLEAAAAVAR